MLDDLAVLIEAENIDARPVLITVRGPFLVAMENDTVSFRDGTLEVHAFAWVFRSHALESINHVESSKPLSVQATIAQNL